MRQRPHLVTRLARYGALSIVALVVASCGGSGDDNGGGSGSTPTPGPSNTPPASASQSTDGFIAFLKVLVPTMPNNTEPLDVTSFVAPQSNNIEPDPSI